MAGDLDSKTSKPGDTAERVSRYYGTLGQGDEEYARNVTAFYNLITDFCERGWGKSIHFASMKGGESFEEAIARHEYYLGENIGMKPGMKVLDVGCGVGGPQRSLAKKFGASIVGLNINQYQLGKCSVYNQEAGLEHLCSLLHGDFLNIPAEDRSFDAAYHIEAISHAPDKTAAFAEVFRVLRPGGIFVGYDCCMTPLYDAGNPEQRKLKEEMIYNNALPQIPSFTELNDSLQAVGFELLDTHDRALDSDPETPWYGALEGKSLSMRGFPRTPLGRKVISAVLRVLEGIRVAPRGSHEVQRVLNMAADSFLTAGRLGIFTPMYYHKVRKPG